MGRSADNNIPRSKLSAYESLYRIAPNSDAPQRVLTEGGSGARWLVAAGDAATAAIDKGDGRSTIWEFTGDHEQTQGATVNDSPMGTDEWGVDKPVVAGDNALGYLSVDSNDGVESIVQVRPNSQRERVIARIHSQYARDSYAPPSVVTLAGSLFYIDPATDTGRELRRVTPRPLASTR